MSIHQTLLKLFFCTQLIVCIEASFTPWLRPYDYMFFPKKWPEQQASLFNMMAGGFSPHAYNALGQRVNAFQIFSPTQDALSMLKGFPINTKQGQIAQAINVDNDDNIRGNFNMTGNFNIVWSYALVERFNITPDWTFYFCLPMHTVTASHISWIDLTQSITADDILTKQLITNDIAENVALWGNGLSLDGWSKAGIGDCSIAINWSKEFKQYKNYIKKVDPRASFQISFPTGVKMDPDKPLSLPFGNDGAFTIIFDIGLLVNFSHWLNVGFNCQFIQALEHTSDQRIKTDIDQTEFLLLTKTAVTVNEGLVQRFDLFAETYFNDALSLRVLYNYIRHSASTLYVISNEYSSLVANSATGLQGWTSHNMIFQFRLDTATEDNQRFRPQMFAFWKHPFNGKQSIAMNYIGLGLEVTF